MYRVFSPAVFVGQPRTIAPHVGAGLGVALATLLGCADPTRPTFPGAAGLDATAPDIQVTAPPPADTIVIAGASVNVAVTVRDASGITLVEVGVTGATAFSFPDVFPNDSTVSMTFPVPTTRGKTGRVIMHIDATDALGNGSTKTFAFVVK